MGRIIVPGSLSPEAGPSQSSSSNNWCVRHPSANQQYIAVLSCRSTIPPDKSAALEAVPLHEFRALGNGHSDKGNS